MKKLLVLAFLTILVPFPASSSIIYVGENGYSSLQEAVNASSAGDTIIIQDGFYNGTEIDKPLILRGEGGIINGDLIIKADNVTIENLIIKDAYHALEIQGDGNIVRNCTIAGNSYGIKIDGDNNSIVSNKIFKNKFYGIDMDYSFSCKIKNNIIYENGWGIYMEHADFNVIVGNIVKNNSEGIKIQASNSNVVKLNNISNNEYKGIHMCCKSRGNYIFMNNFFGNKVNAYVYADENQWDFGGKGNYWDDYNGSGNYSIYKGNIDHYPSLQPYEIGIPSNSEIIIFFPEEDEKVKGTIKVEGMNEAGGSVEWRIDNGTWNNASGTFFWSFLLDTEKMDNGYHTIEIKCGDVMTKRQIYVENSRESPSFMAIFSVLSFILIFLKRYKKKGKRKVISRLGCRD